MTDFSDLFTNPYTVAALALILVVGVRKLDTKYNWGLPEWFPFAFTGALAFTVWLLSSILTADMQLELTDALGWIATVVVAAGYSVFAVAKAPKESEEVSRGIASAWPSPKQSSRRVWSLR